MQEHVSFTFKAPFVTLNSITPNTRHIWIVCHGYAQMAERFIQKFSILDPNENFILAPQGLSRFYFDTYTKIGASWMTREDRETDLENQRGYIDAIFENVFDGVDLSRYKLHLLGFSQGASMICRIAAHKKIEFSELILWAGGFPKELSANDFQFLGQGAKLKVVLGSKDEYYKSVDYKKELGYMEQGTGLKANFIRYEGTHKIEKSVLKRVIDSE
ncbi:MAG: hypothetical protein JXQ96_11235 [Cyclobacteriaceae bacterium]